MNLETLFQADPAAQELGLRQFGLEQDQGKAKLAQLFQQMQHAEQRQPLELAQLQLGNETSQAQLPGIKAKSQLLGDDARYSAETISKRIEDGLAEHKGKITKQHLEELRSMGDAFSQAGPLLRDMPGLATHEQARKILGPMYLEAFDKVTPQALGGVLSMLGKQMVTSQSKYIQQDEQARLKAEEAKALAETKEKARLETETFKARLRENLERLKEELKTTKDPKKYEEAATQLMLAAQQEKDDDRKQELLKQANSFFQLQAQMQRERAEAAKAGKIDPGAATGMPTVPSAPLPNVPGLASPQPASPAKPSSLADLQKMYPGVPPEKLKEAFKKKFGVDLQ